MFDSTATASSDSFLLVVAVLNQVEMSTRQSSNDGDPGDGQWWQWLYSAEAEESGNDGEKRRREDTGMATGAGADADGRRQQETGGRHADDECGIAAAGTTGRRGDSETDRATAMNDDAPQSSEMQGADRGRKRRRRRNGEAVSTRRRTHTVAAWTRGAYQQMHETLTIDLTMEDDDYAGVT